MKRRIAIDGHNLALQRGTGVATYARNLADNASDLGWHVSTLFGAPISARMSPLLREITFFDYMGGVGPHKSKFSNAYSLARELIRAPLGYSSVEIPVTGAVETRRFAQKLPSSTTILNVCNLFHVARRHFQRYGRFLEVTLPRGTDLMHWTYPLPVKARGIPNIYTIHDIVPLRLPYTTLDDKRYYYRLIKACISNGHICTVSEKSKNDIIKMFDFSRDRISNTYQAVNTSNGGAGQTQEEVELEVKGLYGLDPQSYFLFFGAIEPKKNVGRLIEAFLSAPVESKLVIVGAMAWKADEEMKLVNGMLQKMPHIRERIQIFDYVPRRSLLNLIRAAKAVVFPSLYEGFGLPVLEAMQLGTPTLCSSAGSLGEIAGESALFVDPYDVHSIADGLRRLERDDQLRNRLSIDGVLRAEMFNAKTYRERLTEMYDNVLLKFN